MVPGVLEHRGEGQRALPGAYTGLEAPANRPVPSTTAAFYSAACHGTPVWGRG